MQKTAHRHVVGRVFRPGVDRTRISRALVVPAAVVLALWGEALSGDSYTDAVEQWRRDYEAGLRAEDGYLSVAGLFFLEPGETTFGAGRGSGIELPAGSTAAKAGAFRLKDGRVFVSIAHGVGATVNGVSVRDAELRPASAEPPRGADLLRLGRLTLLAHRSGPRLAIRLRDPEHALRREFSGARWYPVDARWRIVGTFVAYPAPREVTVPNTMGDEVTLHSPGEVEFTAAGARQRVQAVAEPDGRLWVIFTDATAGTTTYKAARFLYADAPQDGRVVLDFNRAHNPACAYNPFTTCPYPPAQNRLRVAIEAGELDYGRH
jgi:hypothetical protein